MPWTKTNYPPEMKYLPLEVRNRAIKIVNSLLKETSMQEGSAIYAAISMARGTSTKQEIKDDAGLKQRGTRSKGKCKERFVIPYNDGWAIRVEHCQNVQEVFRTKKQAVEQARREAFLTGAAVTIYKKDGVVEKRVKYNRHTRSHENGKYRLEKKAVSKQVL